MSIPLFFAALRQGERNHLYVDGGGQLNYPVKPFDRRRYIADEEPEAARGTAYYNRENVRFLLQRPGHSPYVYNRQTLACGWTAPRRSPCSATTKPPQGKPITRLLTTPSP